MGNIVEAKVDIRGVRPLLWHWFGPDAIPLEKKEKVGVAGNNPEEWRGTVLVTKQGQLYLEPSYVFGAMAGKNGGAKYTRRGRGTIVKYVAATLQVVENRILVDRFFPGYPEAGEFDINTVEAPPQDSDLPVYLDVRGVVNPSTRGRNIRYRIAASPGWQCSFTLLWDKTVVSRGELEAVMIDTGKLVGLGNGRTIGFGRFDVVKFDVSE